MKYTTKSIVKAKPKQTTKPVTTPIAQIGTLCDKNFDENKEIFELQRSLDKMKNKHKLEYYVCVFMLETGCRISEALNVKCTDIDALGRVRIKGLKNSNNRIVTSPSCREFFLLQKKNGGDIFTRLNRFHLYRICKMYGIGSKFEGNKKNSITHYFRHINALFAKNISENLHEIRQTLGHKTEKSTMYYLKNKKTIRYKERCE